MKKEVEKTKILVAMSGGVDSSVAAGVLLEQGYAIEGAYMKNWINEEGVAGHCPWEEDIEDARSVCEHLGIPFRVVNFMQDYKEKVVSYLLEGYAGGITPNPDVMCNKEIKFGIFLDYALDEGFDGIATGHYARIECKKNGTVALLRGLDPNKDQSYFLALLRKEQLEKAYFPIGGMRKEAVRKKAMELGLATAGKKDSQGICFIGQVKMGDFLKEFVPDKRGDIVNLEGKKLGEHKGLHYFTLGQRRGIQVPSNVEGRYYVVVRKDWESNALVIGLEGRETAFLYAQECRVGGITFVREVYEGAHALGVQPRYRAGDFAAQVEFAALGKGKYEARVFFEKQQRALTCGQICALYAGEELIGGGVFEEIQHTPQ